MRLRTNIPKHVDGFKKIENKEINPYLLTIAVFFEFFHYIFSFNDIRV